MKFDKHPFQVRFIESVVFSHCLSNCVEELVRNAKQPFDSKAPPSSIREFWRERTYTGWDEYRKAWVIFDNFELGTHSLCFYPERNQWTNHVPMADWETDLTHEEAEKQAHAIYTYRKESFVFYDTNYGALA